MGDMQICKLRRCFIVWVLIWIGLVGICIKVEWNYANYLAAANRRDRMNFSFSPTILQMCVQDGSVWFES
jgi:hypothetical protein